MLTTFEIEHRSRRHCIIRGQAQYDPESTRDERI